MLSFSAFNGSSATTVTENLDFFTTFVFLVGFKAGFVGASLEIPASELCKGVVTVSRTVRAEVAGAEDTEVVVVLVAVVLIRAAVIVLAVVEDTYLAISISEGVMAATAVVEATPVIGAAPARTSVGAMDTMLALTMARGDLMGSPGRTPAGPIMPGASCGV